MPDKPPYKLTVKLDGVKPEHIAAALNELRERAAEYDQTGEASATMTIEGYQESPLINVMEAFETWLFYHGKVDCEMTVKRPGLRPETRELLAREKQRTPMDAIQGFADKYGATIELSSGDKSVTLTAETARNASAMLRESLVDRYADDAALAERPIGSDGWGADTGPWEG